MSKTDFLAKGVESRSIPEPHETVNLNQGGHQMTSNVGSQAVLNEDGPNREPTINIMDFAPSPQIEGAEGRGPVKPVQQSNGLWKFWAKDDEECFVFFAQQGEPKEFAFIRDPNFKGWVRSSGPDCVLHEAGIKVWRNLLLPVYSPEWDKVGVFMIDESRVPTALLPQLEVAFKDHGLEKPLPIFLSLSGKTFNVTPCPEVRDKFVGNPAIVAFQEDYKAGRITLASAYPQPSNEDLEEIPVIARKLELRRALRGLD
jgi:hypothetical protein